MSGHSKWSSIKRKKAVTDAKRGQHFTKLIREITVAAREGGGSLEGNHRLRLAVDTAKAANMPAENIERAIKKGTGEIEGVVYQEVVYEGYGPGGVALYLEVMTDNGNRTVAALRHMLERNGGNLGASGSVAWQFDRKGQVFVDTSQYEEDRVLEAALEAGAEDLAREGSDYLITCEAAVFQEVQEGLGRAGIEPSQTEMSMIPKAGVDVAGEDAERLIKLIGLLEDHDDVQKVYSNGNIDEELLARVG
ncbi:MAG TPA: YebC/PmpR family DNA-binding transcriptional regulator [Gemmatimonadetes bacterium]|nr:YebC/PmpR family DNA-binding transcriptional regulator [Gemmatimonadota bacterium]